MRLIARAERPLRPGPIELAACPDTRDRGVAWSWSISGVVHDGAVHEVLVTQDDQRVRSDTERCRVDGAGRRVRIDAGHEAVLVAVDGDVTVRSDGWHTVLGAGDVLVSDGEGERVLDLEAARPADVTVTTLAWLDGRPMRWVP